MEIDPLFPALLVPVAKTSSPLTPAAPEFTVERFSVPLDVCVLKPDNMAIAPPDDEAVVVPDDSRISPPLALFPEPTTKRIAPLFPAVEWPV
jgi:hypothetical protein